MITNFKLYEKLNDGMPEVGDYVICSKSDFSSDEFVENNIGKILKDDKSNYYPYYITYDNIPDSLIDRRVNKIATILFKRKDILYWSKDKEELEAILQTNKFNL